MNEATINNHCDIGNHDVGERWTGRCAICERRVCYEHCGNPEDSGYVACPDHIQEVAALNVDRSRGWHQHWQEREDNIELEDRYLVIKCADIEAALTPTEQDMLLWLANNVDIYRLKQGKPVNSYVVINQDEPYFPAVLALMEAHQNKETHAAEIAQRRSQGARDGWEIRRSKQGRKP